MAEALKDKLKNYSPKQLIEILENQGDYAPELIRLARKELTNRQLSIAEIGLIAKEIRRKKEAKRSAEPFPKELFERITKSFKEWFSSKERLILAASIIMGFISLVNLPETISLIQFIFTNELNWDWQSLEAIMPIFLLLIGAMGLLLEKKWAWKISIIILAFFVVKMLLFIIWQIRIDENPMVDMVLPINQKVFQLSMLFSILIHLSIFMILISRRVVLRLGVTLKEQVVFLVIGIILALILYGNLVFSKQELKMENRLEKLEIEAIE